ncbi:hypothetical protein IJM86_00855 [bacterium]|nr:hypothetical protein [bacterium]
MEDFVAWSGKLLRVIKRPRTITIRKVNGNSETLVNKKGESLIAEAGKHVVCYNVKNGNPVDPYPMTFEALAENWQNSGQKLEGMDIYEGKGIQTKVLVTVEFYNAHIDLMNQFVDPTWKETTSVAGTEDPVFVKDKVATTEAGDSKYQDIRKYGWVVLNFTKQGYIYDVYPNDATKYYFVNAPEELIEYIKRVAS